MEHTTNLTNHNRTILHITLMGSQIQTASAKFLQLFYRSIVAFHFCILTSHLVSQNANRMASGTTGNNSRTILGLQNQILVVWMSNTLLRYYEAGAHLYSRSTQSKGCHNTTGITNTASTNNRYIYSIYYLWNQSHSSNLTYMAARLSTLSNNSIYARTHQTLSQGNRSYYRNNLGTYLFQGWQILSRIACTSSNYSHTLINYYLHNLFDKRRHQHDVYAKWLVSPFLSLLNLCPQQIRRHMAGTNNTKAASIGYSGGQLSSTNPGHTALEYRIFNI